MLRFPLVLLDGNKKWPLKVSSASWLIVMVIWFSVPQMKFIPFTSQTSFPHLIDMASLVSYLPRLKTLVIVTLSLSLPFTSKALLKFSLPFFSPSHYCCPFLVQLWNFFSYYYCLLNGLPVSSVCFSPKYPP